MCAEIVYHRTAQAGVRKLPRVYGARVLFHMCIEEGDRALQRCRKIARDVVIVARIAVEFSQSFSRGDLLVEEL